MTVYVQAEIVLPMTHASGNQLNHNTKTNQVYREKSYHTYQEYIVQVLQELADEMQWEVPQNVPLQLKMMFTYRIPNSKIDTQAKMAKFQSGMIYPITRSTKDLDNSAKAAGDALQMAFDFDDSQFIFEILGKQYGEQNKLFIEISDAF
jgi:Holliday junction resolvase RusA-like endonuclease